MNGMWLSWGQTVLSQSSSGNTHIWGMCYFQKVSRVALSDDQVMKLQIWGFVVNKRNSLLTVSRQHDYRARDQAGDPRWMPSWMCFKFICPCPQLYLCQCPLHLKMTRLLDLFPALSSTMFCILPWCRAEGESFSHPCLCSPVSHTARWQAGIVGSFWLLTEWRSPHDLWSGGRKMGLSLLGAWRYPSPFPFSTGKQQTCFCLLVCLFVGEASSWVFRWPCFRDAAF